MKIIIETITDWEKDDAEIAGDRDHGGLSESNILLSLAKETKDKKKSKDTKGGKRWKRNKRRLYQQQSI